MEAGTVALIIRDCISLAQNQGVIRADGKVIGPRTAQQDIELAVGVEGILKTYGVAIPDKIDSAVKILPLVLDFLM